jgi:hypothetical protein
MGIEARDYSKEEERLPMKEKNVVHDVSSIGEGKDVLALQDTDAALNAKMHIVNNVRTASKLLRKLPMKMLMTF